MWFILLCSIIVVVIISDRLIAIKKAKLNVPAFLVKLRSILKKKDIPAAMLFCIEEKSPASNIIRKGLKKYNYGHQRVKEAIESAGKQEIIKLEKGLSILATISGVAPLLGFLGTVLGMIGTFLKIENLHVPVIPADLAGGIWEALLTSAFGLVVGIVSFIFYNYLLSHINRLVAELEIVSNDVLDIIEDVNKGVLTDEDLFTTEV